MALPTKEVHVGWLCGLTYQGVHDDAHKTEHLELNSQASPTLALHPTVQVTHTKAVLQRHLTVYSFDGFSNVKNLLQSRCLK